VLDVKPPDNLDRSGHTPIIYNIMILRWYYMTTKFKISMPDWMMEELIGDTDNRSERIRELMVKGDKYEDLQRLAGTNDLHRYVASTGPLSKEEGRDGPDGDHRFSNTIYTFGGYNYTGGHSQGIPA